MYGYNRLLVGLRLDGTDASTIRYARLVSRMANSDVVHFAHVAPLVELPEFLRQGHDKAEAPLETRLRKRMADELGLLEDHHPAREEHLIEEGTPSFELLRWTKLEKIDLVVLGTDVGRERAPRIVRRMARKAPCSVLVVPRGAKPEVRKILVAIDFSDACLEALNAAIAFALAAGLSKILCVHVYDVPSEYRPAETSRWDFARLLEQHTSDRARAFLDRADSRGIELVLELQAGQDVPRLVQDLARKESADLLVVAARGRGAIAGVLLGSVTEHLLARTTIPILAVKEKGAGMRLLDAILRR